MVEHTSDLQSGQYLTVKGAAIKTGYTPDYISRLIRSNEIDSIKTANGKRLVDEKSLAAFVARRQIEKETRKKQLREERLVEAGHGSKFQLVKLFDLSKKHQALVTMMAVMCLSLLLPTGLFLSREHDVLGRFGNYVEDEVNKFAALADKQLAAIYGVIDNTFCDYFNNFSLETLVGCTIEDVRNIAVIYEDDIDESDEQDSDVPAAITTQVSSNNYVTVEMLFAVLEPLRATIGSLNPITSSLSIDASSVLSLQQQIDDLKEEISSVDTKVYVNTSANIDNVLESIDNVTENTSITGTFTLSDFTQGVLVADSGGSVSSSIGTNGYVLQTTATGTQWVATSSLGFISGTGLLSLNGQTGNAQTFDTATSSGLNLTVSSAGNTHTFTAGLASGYTIPLTASTTEWATAYGWGDHSLAGYLTSVSSSSLSAANWTNGYVLQASTTAAGGFDWVATSTLGIAGGGGSGTVTSVAATVPTGWTISGSPITNAGTLAFSYDAGYGAVLTASTTAWNSFYNTPSSRITAGTNVSWTSNTLNVDTDLANYSNASSLFLDGVTATGLEKSGTDVALSSGYIIPLTASTTAWNTTYNTVTASSTYWDQAYASTTALSNAYIRGLFSNSATGLTYNSSTGGTSLTSGYVIPLTASTTAWNSFYNTPSSRITAGTGLSWSSNTLNAEVQSSDLNNYLTIADWNSTTTDALAEGSTNKYYSSSLFNADLAATSSIDSITTLSNLATLGTITSGTWNGTAIDISSYTNLGVTAAGLELSGDNIALTSGYVIPLTASTTEWATAYGWGDHSLAGYLTSVSSSSLSAANWTNGYVLQASTTAAGGFDWVSTTTLGFVGGSSLWTESGSNIYFNTGNVGIGSSSPSRKLTVEGDSYFGGGITATGTVTFTSTATTTFAGNIGITGDIIPSADNTYSLGTANYMWKDIYVGPGSLYVNGKKVIQDVSDTITFSTDSGQNLAIETAGVGSVSTEATGSGNVNLLADSGNININSSSGNLNIGTTGTGNLNFGTITSGVWNGTAITDAYISDTLTIGSGSTLADGLVSSSTLTALNYQNGYVLQASTTAAGGFDWVSTTTLGFVGGSSLWTESGSNIYFNTGNVGIGSSSPNTKLTLEATEDTALLALGDSTNATQANVYTGTTTPNGRVSAPRGSLYIDTSSGSLYQNTDGTTVWNAFTQGTTTHMARMSSTAGQDVANPGVYVDFDNIEYDTGGIADSANDRFTIQKDGKYLITASAGFIDVSSSDTCQFQIRVNGTTIVDTDHRSGSNLEDLGSSLTDTQDLQAGDYAQFFIVCYNSTENTQTSKSRQPRMSVIELAPTGGTGIDLFTDAGDDSYLTSTSDNLLIGTTTNNASAKFVIRQQNANDIVNIFDGSTEVFSIIDGGNVGIGTTTPTHTLSVAGDFYATGIFYDSSNNAGTNGYVLQTTATGTQWVATSSLGITSGTVTSIAASVPTGWTVTGSPITDSGTLAFSYDTGYGAVLTASTTEWATAYGWGDHSLAGYLTSVSSSSLSAANWTNGYVLQASTTAAGGFDWVATSTLGLGGGSSVTFGTDNQIPFTNSGGTDFDYSSLFTFDGSDLTVNATSSLATTTVSNLLTLSGSAANIALGSNYLSGDGGDEGVFVDSSGNVGIGTNSPATRLAIGSPSSEIASSINAEGITLSVTGSTVFGLENTAASGASGGGFMSFYSNDGAALASGDRLGGFVFGGQDGGGVLRHGGGIVAYADASWSSTTDAPTRLEFEVAPDGSASRSTALTIDSTGYIGIGTNAPSFNVHVQKTGDAQVIIEADSDNSGESDNPILQLRQDGAVINGSFGLVGDAGELFTGSLGNGTYISSSDTGTAAALQLVTNNNARLTIADAGNIGIGDTSPAYLLTVGNGDLFGVNSSGMIATESVSSSSLAISNWANGYVMMASSTAANGFDWVATSTLGISSGSSITFGTDNQIPFTNSGGTDFEYSSSLTYDGTNLNIGSNNGYAIGGTRFFYASTTNDSILIGESSGSSLTATALRNIGIGANTLSNLATGDDSVAIGDSALTWNEESRNTAIGAGALGAGSFGLNNTAIGYSAGNGVEGGDNNLLLGYQAANSLTTGSNNIAIGYDVELPSNTASNQLTIGNLIFGTGIDGTGTTLSSGNIGIGSSSPNAKLAIEATEDTALLALGDSTNATQANVYTGTTTPNGRVSAPRGSLYIDTSSGSLYQNTDGTTVWNAFTQGTTTHSAKMTRDAAQSIPATTWTKIAFDNIEYDTGGIADASTNDRFDIKKDGTYLVTAKYCLNGNRSHHLMVVINGVDTSRVYHNDGSTTDYCSVISDTFDLSSGDYVEMEVYVFDSNSTATGIDKPTMSVIELAPTGGTGIDLFTDGGSDTYLTSTSDNILIGTTTNNAAAKFVIRQQNANDIVNIFDGSTEVFSIIDGGNVGIGTTTPNSTLDVWGNLTVGTSSTPTLFVQTSSGRVGIGTTDPGELLDITKANGAGNVGLRFLQTGQVEYKIGINDSDDKLYITNNNGASAIGSNATGLVLTSTGNVGLGTSSPSKSLHVYNATVDQVALFESGDSAGGIELRDNSTTANSVLLRAVGNEFELYTGGVATLRVDSSGNVGIGTTTPGAELHVDGTGGGVTSIVENSGTSGWLEFRESGTIRGYLGYQDTGLFSNGLSDSLALRSQGALMLGNGSTADLVIDTSGNVGIGTTTPDSKLHVYGTETISSASVHFTLQENAGSEFAYIGGDDTDGLYINAGGTADTLRLQTGGTERLRIDSSGNVGIGTSSPDQKLTLQGLQSFKNSSSVSYGYIGIGDDALTSIGSVTNNELIVRGDAGVVFGVGGFEYARLSSSGYLGIGTTSPVANLAISGSSSDVKFALANTGTSGETWQLVSANSDSGAGAGNFAIHLFGDLYSASKFVITPTGNVGIGTTTPGYTLTTDGAGYFTGAVYGDSIFRSVNGGSASVPSIQPGNDNDTGMFWAASNQLGFSTGGTERLRIDSSGNVGIGTTSPESRLAIVSGSISLWRVTQSSFIGYGDQDSNSVTNVGANDFYISGGDSNDFILASRANNAGEGIKFGNTSSGTFTEHMIIDGISGNLGIGTTTPAQLLHLFAGESGQDANGAADVVIENSGSTYLNFLTPSANESGILFGDAESTNRGRLLYDHADDALELWAGGAQQLTVTSSGNVGIGTSSPVGQLAVHGSSWTTSQIIADTNDPALQLTSDGSSINTGWSMRMDVSDSNGLEWRYDNDRKLTVATSGEFGIGTSTPDELLHVYGTAAGEGARIGNAFIGVYSNTNYAEFAHNAVKTNASSYALLQEVSGETFLNAASSQPINFRIGNQDKMRLTSSGTFGIGDTSPDGSLLLDVEGAVGASTLCDENGSNCAAVSSLTTGWLTTTLNYAISSSTTSYVGEALTVSGEDSVPRDMIFNGDGTKLYMVGSTNDTIYQYSLSTAYDISTAGAGSSALSVAWADFTRSLLFNDDGTKLFVLDSALEDIYEYTLSTPYDISTAGTGSKVFDVGAIDNNPQDMIFNDDGTKWYVLSSDGDDINEYTLSTPYDISTAGSATVALSVASEELYPVNMEFNNTGTSLYVTGQNPKVIFEYYLSTPFDISTGIYRGISYSLLSQDSNPTSLLFNDDGTTLYMLGITNGKVFEYDLTTDNNVVYYAGRAGVGTTTPTDKLQIVGDVRVGTGTTGCVKDADGTVIAGTCSSDARLKTNILTASSTLDSFADLNFVTYNWNELAKKTYYYGTEATQYGLIADEVAEVFPELVHTDDRGYKTLDYSTLSLYGLKATQEVNEKLESLASTTSIAERLSLENLASTTPDELGALPSRSFFARFFDGLIAWFADTTNGIGDFFAGRLHTDELCVLDDEGETCVDRQGLEALLVNSSTSTNTTNDDEVLCLGNTCVDEDGLRELLRENNVNVIRPDTIENQEEQATTTNNGTDTATTTEEVATTTDNGTNNASSTDNGTDVSTTTEEVIEEDTTPPEITGTDNATITEGDTFNPMEGVSATDDTDGDVTSNITVSGTVDTNTPDTYTLTYTVSDQSGNETTTDRTITVEALAEPETETEDTASSTESGA